MSTDSQRQTYFDHLRLPPPGTSPSHIAALARAHELRKFEIDNYWKRSAYFWGFQLVAFGALALTSDKDGFDPPVVMIVSVLGALAALTGVLTAKGSKFWQQSWEHHVDFLEREVEGNLHGIALTKESNVSFSVSRVNERFLVAILTGWIAAFIAGATVLIWPELLDLNAHDARKIQIGIPAAAMALGSVWLIMGSRSNVRDRTYRLPNLTKL